jgi:hypothetical protein
MEVTVIDGKTLVSKDYSLPYDIGDIVNIIRPGRILPKSTVVKLFGLNIYPKEEFAEYPSHLQDKSWKIVNVMSNYSFELCILLVSRDKEYVAISHVVRSILDTTPPIETIRKTNKKNIAVFPRIKIKSKY